MFKFFKFNKLPEERFENTSNPSMYTQRIKDLAKKSFYIDNVKEVELKKIPFCYEILPLLNKFHTSFGHIHPQKLSKALLNSDFYMQGLDIITNQLCIEYPECHSKFFSKNIIKSPAIIIDEHI